MSEKDLEAAYNAIMNKQAAYDLLWRYYDGDHPLLYSTERLERIFNDIKLLFVENWCSVVIDSVLERTQLTRFEVGGDELATSILEQLWISTELALDSDDAHLAALVTGEAFIIAWPDEDDVLQAYYNDPRMCHMQYRTDNPHKRAWAAKWWEDEEKRNHITLYYPDKLEYYVTPKEAEDISSYTAFNPQTDDEGGAEAPNPFEEIPVYHLRRERRAIRSELTASILTMQVGVNKIFSDMMVVSEFGAFPQRFIISNADTSQLKNAPNEIWEIAAGDGLGQAATVGQLAAASLKNYIEGLDHISGSIATISRTPRHFFFGQGGTPSGEALIALEAPLNKKCKRYHKRFGHTWKHLAAFLLRLSGYTVEADVITPIWEAAETVQPKTEAETREINVRTGVPLITTLRADGWSQSDLDQMMDDKATEETASSASLAQALIEQQRQLDTEGLS